MIKFLKNLLNSSSLNKENDKLHQQIKINVVNNKINDVTNDIIDLSKDITKKLKNDIHDTDKKLTTVCNLLQDQLLIVDTTAKIQFINDSAKKYFNYDFIAGKDLFDVMEIESYDYIRELYQSTLKKNNMDYYNVIINNVLYKMQISISYVEFIDKKNVYIIIFNNITDRIEYEEDLIESNEKFKTFSELANDAMVIVKDGNIIQSNTLFSVKSEYIPREFNTLNFNKLFDNLPEYGKLRRHETFLNTKNNKKINVSISRENVMWDDDIAQIYVIRDITRYKQIQTSLELKANRYSDLLDDSYISICCFDSSLNVTYMNSSFIEEFNLQYPINTNILNFLPEEDKEQFIKDLTSISNENNASRSLHVHEGKYKDWICYGKFNTNGVLEEYQCSIRDITNYYQ